ncbi:immunoglobulin-like domain-containing protein, partial [Clostridium sp.]|uniref:immunoglobulin-like domain-containing protein n=1 Tax=Clostridium sp. TaxID=1506 RepID=UPI001B6AF81B
KITGAVINEDENYDDGIDNIDKIQDIKFKLTEYGLESVYNTAPKITFNGPLNASLGDDIDYMQGVTIEDDHDKEDEIKVEVSELPNGGQIGSNEVTYTVTDLWGKSTTETRTVNLSNALDNNVIEFMGHRLPNSEDSEVAMRLGFDTSTMTLKVYDVQHIQFRPGLHDTEYRFRLYHNGSSNPIQYSVSGTTYADESGLNRLNGQVFKYGDTITLYAWHQDLLRIQGPVRGAQEDYSDGVQQGDSYTMATFKITQKGLVVDYAKNSNIDQDNYVTILPSAREGYPMLLRINLDDNHIGAFERKGYSIEYGTNEKALEVILYNSDGTPKRTLTMTGNQNPKDHSESTTLDGEFTPGSYDEHGNYVPGDYITIYHRTPKNLSIRGNETLFTGGREDYSDGIDDIENMDNLVLRLLDNKVEAVYVDPPTIDGTVDKIMFKGDTLNEEEFRQGVTATDPFEGSLTDSIEITHNISTDTNNILNKIGLYDVRYTVANSKGLSTTVTSTVEVQAKPIIEVNTNKTIVQLDSVKNTPKDIEEYLKTVVTITDEEDDAKGLPIKLDIEGTFNPSEYGYNKITYIATDSHGNKTTKEVTIQVKRDINVTVPTTIPFQVVTNLKDKEADPFISGVLNLQNNNTSTVDVFVQSFTKEADSGGLELVDPTDYDWDNLSGEESIKKMALGMYVKSGIVGKSPFVEESPLWLKDGEIHEVPLGIIPRAESIGNPSECKLSFTSKHAKNFIGGRAKGKFRLVFRFE